MQIGERLGPNPGNGGSTRMGGWQYGQEDYDDRDDNRGDDRGDNRGDDDDGTWKNKALVGIYGCVWGPRDKGDGRN